MDIGYSFAYFSVSNPVDTVYYLAEDILQDPCSKPVDTVGNSTDIDFVKNPENCSENKADTLDHIERSLVDNLSTLVDIGFANNFGKALRNFVEYNFLDTVNTLQYPFDFGNHQRVNMADSMELVRSSIRGRFHNASLGIDEGSSCNNSYSSIEESVCI